MPELPEVETVRRGLQAAVGGATLGEPHVLHPRVVRRQPGGPEHLRELTGGRTVVAARRRGKYLWLELAGGGQRPDVALAAHLGMSGQFRIVGQEDLHDDGHLRVWWPLTGGRVLAFRDQRTFGWVVAEPVTDRVPRVLAHIAPDPFEGEYDPDAVARRIRRSRSSIKTVLLAQTIVSGIGNIYADEALWRARVHPAHPSDRLALGRVREVLDSARDVMSDALTAGGTSFDPLYVAVNGESGWFDRSLAVYGRAGEPCERCGTAIVRERFTNRSSHRCPRCQPRPRLRG